MLAFTVWHKIFVGVYFCRLAILCVLWELIFTIRTDWFFLLEINFCDFQEVPDKSMIIFLFLLRTCNEIINNYISFFSNNTTACLPYVKPVTELCVSF